MIAAIEEQHSVVWGVGRTDAEAISDAHHQAISDAHHQASKKVGIHMGKLRCVPLDGRVNIDKLDGYGLWPFCKLDPEKQVTQMELI